MFHLLRLLRVYPSASTLSTSTAKYMKDTTDVADLYSSMVEWDSSAVLLKVGKPVPIPCKVDSATDSDEIDCFLVHTLWANTTAENVWSDGPFDASNGGGVDYRALYTGAAEERYFNTHLYRNTKDPYIRIMPAPLRQNPAKYVESRVDLGIPVKRVKSSVSISGMLRPYINPCPAAELDATACQQSYSAKAGAAYVVGQCGIAFTKSKSSVVCTKSNPSVCTIDNHGMKAQSCTVKTGGTNPQCEAANGCSAANGRCGSAADCTSASTAGGHSGAANACEFTAGVMLVLDYTARTGGVFVKDHRDYTTYTAPDMFLRNGDTLAVHNPTANTFELQYKDNSNEYRMLKGDNADDIEGLTFTFGQVCRLNIWDVTGGTAAMQVYAYTKLPYTDLICADGDCGGLEMGDAVTIDETTSPFTLVTPGPRHGKTVRVLRRPFWSSDLKGVGGAPLVSTFKPSPHKTVITKSSVMCSSATPSVCTIDSHGLKDGDLLTLNDDARTSSNARLNYDGAVCSCILSCSCVHASYPETGEVLQVYLAFANTFQLKYKSSVGDYTDTLKGNGGSNIEGLQFQWDTAGTCTGSAGAADAVCDAVLSGNEATCVGTVDSTTGDACSWTAVYAGAPVAARRVIRLGLDTSDNAEFTGAGMKLSKNSCESEEHPTTSDIAPGTAPGNEMWAAAVANPLRYMAAGTRRRLMYRSVAEDAAEKAKEEKEAKEAKEGEEQQQREEQTVGQQSGKRPRQLLTSTTPMAQEAGTGYVLRSSYRSTSAVGGSKYLALQGCTVADAGVQCAPAPHPVRTATFTNLQWFYDDAAKVNKLFVTVPRNVFKPNDVVVVSDFQVR